MIVVLLDCVPQVSVYACIYISYIETYAHILCHALEHGSQSSHAFGLLDLFQGHFLNHQYLRARKQVTSQKAMQYMIPILLLQDLRHSLSALLFGR